MNNYDTNRTLFISGLGSECSLGDIRQLIITQHGDCIESAVYYKDKGTAFLNIDNQTNYNSLLEYFYENELYYNGIKCSLRKSLTPMRISGIASLLNKKEVSIWSRHPIGEDINKLIKTAEKLDTDIQIIFRKITGLLSLKGNIMGSSLLQKYYKHYHEILDFQGKFGYLKLLTFLRHGESLHYFHLNHSVSQDVQICLRKEDSCYEVTSSGRLKRNFERMTESRKINIIVPSPKKNIFRTPPWRK